MARIFISTGEVSGDLQGSLLIEGLKRQATRAGLSLEITALGGPRMAETGVNLISDTTGIGSVGILESMPYILPTLKIQQKVKQYLRLQRPDVVVLIDYMGPNLSFGSYIKQHLPGVPIIWYIAPQVWVWSPPWQDADRIVALSDYLLAIFPEEARYFQAKNAKVSWVGHPLVDRMQAAPSREVARELLGISASQLAVALLPASRQQEIKYLMPILFEAAKILQTKLPQIHFWIPVSRDVYRSSIEQAVTSYGLQATILAGQSLEVLAASDLAITKSGTVNLEIALLNIPQVVVYRVSPLTYWLAKNLLNFSIPFMSPANLVEMQSIVPELLQEQATPDNIVSQAMDLLLNQTRRAETFEHYQKMRQALGALGVCDRAAQEILSVLSH